MTSGNKKRRYEDENRSFKSEWEEEYAFIDRNGKPLCLICNQLLAQYKASNLKRHYEQNHTNFIAAYPHNSNLRTNKLNSLKSKLLGQQNLLSSFVKENNTTIEASFAISWNIARAKRPYTEGEFIRKNIEEVVKILDPNNTKLFRLISQIPISRHTTERRITEISKDCVEQLIKNIKASVAFSLALDESTDIQDIPQLAVFIRYVSADMTVNEELLDLVPLKDTTRGIDIKNALDLIISKTGIPLEKLISVATDGAPAMLGKNIGLLGLLKSDEKIPDFLPIHCIVHREHLVAKFFKYENVMKIVLQIVNYIRTSSKNHRQFKNFLEDLDLEDHPNDIPFYCLVRWLSTYNVLSRFVNLIGPITNFLKEKEKYYAQLEDDNWLQDLMFLTDIMEHLQSLNLELQGKQKTIADLTQIIFSFQRKMLLFKHDLITKNFNHFPRLKDKYPEIEDAKLEEYQDRLQKLMDNFKVRFEDLEKFKPYINFLVNPFEIDIISNDFAFPKYLLANKAAGEIELIEIQEDLALKMQHKSSQSPIEFWKFVPGSKYPILKNTACKLISIFGTTYCCESLYSTMKFIKSKHRSQLTNEHLTELIRTALTSYEPNFQRFAANIQNHTRTASTSK